MWTHRWPYSQSLLTRGSIRQAGEIGLYRALNIGKVIGFVGSGVSVAYGQPSWKDLADAAYQSVERTIEEPPSEISQGGDLIQPLRRLARTLKRLGDGGDADSLKLRFELSENFAKEVDKRLPDQRLQQALRRAIAEKVHLDPPKPPSHEDIILHIFERLGIRRFLTLNYDLELERFLVDRGYVWPAIGHAGIDDLLKKDAAKRDLYVSNNSFGQSAITAALTERTVGHGLVFSTLPHAHAVEIFHLHGWIKDPDRMIVTESNYQKTYVRRDALRSVFNEALETTFNGNDVLFVGIGMQEQDLLRPLRQFVSEVRTADTEERRIFALMPYRGESHAVRETLDLKTRFGVHVIHYGEGLNWLKRTFLQSFGESEGEDRKTRIPAAANAVRTMLINDSKSGATVWSRDDGTDRGADRKRSIKRVARKERRDTVSHLKDHELRAAIEDVHTKLDAAADGGADPPQVEDDLLATLFAVEGDACDAFKAYKADDCNQLRSRLLTQALVAKLEKLASGQKQWYRDYLQKQGERAANAALPKNPKSASADKDGLLWVRHRAIYESRERESSVLQDVREHAKALGTGSNRRILRLVARRGSGKGALFHELYDFLPEQSVRAYDTLFDCVSGSGKPQTYRAAYFAHTALSPEFYSVITSLNLWLNEIDERDFPKSNRLRELEHRLLAYTRKVDPAKERLFICLLGLDRLCDRMGVAFSPQHRALFKLLADDRLAAAPLDIVLIAGETLQPIKYLSETGYRATGENAQQLEVTRRRPPAFLASALPTAVAGTTKTVHVSDLHGNRPATLRYETKLELIPLAWTELPALPHSERQCKDKDAGWVGSPIDLDDPPNLNALRDKSVAMDFWIAKCVAQFPTKEEQKHWVQQLEHAALRGNEVEVLRVTSEAYNEKYRDEAGRTALRRTLMRQLAVFSLPVTATVLEQCPDVREALTRLGAPKMSWLQQASDTLDTLQKESLIIRTDPSPAEGVAQDTLAEREIEERRYCLHPRMREYLAHQMGFALSERGERSYYELSLYAVQPKDLPVPAETHFRLLHGILQALIDNTRDWLQRLYTSDTIDEPGQSSDGRTTDREQPSGGELDCRSFHAIIHNLRSAYSIIRGTLSLGALSRLGRFAGNPDEPEEPFEIYRGWLRGILNASAAVKVHEDRIEAALTSDPYGFRHPFYREELLWLYNEAALTSFAQGRLYEALPVFQAALERAQAERTNEPTMDPVRTAERRLKLNYSLALIERGNLVQARQWLQELVAGHGEKRIATPSMTGPLARAYLGLCDHLGGHLERARSSYEAIIGEARERGNLRTLAIFHRHYADLLRLEKKHEEANEHIRLAMHAASQEGHKDILHFTLVAEARLDRDIENRGVMTRVQRKLDEAERYAREMGLIKLQIDALKVRGEVNLLLGETEHAGRLAVRAISLANRHGLRLRKISALTTYARILQARGLIEPSKTLLSKTSDEAERHGYQIKAELIRRLMRELSYPA